MDLPEDKGTYILIAFVARMKRLEIGSLGAFDIVPGFYAYVEPVPVEESHAELGWDRRGFDSKPRELARGR